MRWNELESIKPELVFLWFLFFITFFTKSLIVSIDSNLRYLKISIFIYFDLSARAESSHKALIFGKFNALGALFGSFFPLILSNLGTGSEAPHDQIFLSLHKLFTGDKPSV